MQYQLRVLKTGCPPSTLRLEAATEASARREAEEQGYVVLQARQAAMSLFGKRHPAFPLLLFCQELRVLLEAGLTLPVCIETLAHKESKPSVRESLLAVLRGVQEGKQFSDSLAALPQHFPGLFVASVRACERTGNLPEGLSRYANYLAQVDVLKKHIVSASIYPSLVLGFGMLVLIFLFGYVLPRFSRIYEARAMELSWAAEAFLTLGQTVEGHGALFLGVFLALFGAAAAMLGQPEIRVKLAKSLLRLPQIGDRVRVYHLSRFYRTFSMLLRSGIPVVVALGMISEFLGVALQEQVARARRLISEGRPFSESMETCSLTTSVALQLFRAGEKSGRLDNMMERAADFHEEEMLRWVDAFAKVFEPLLMAAIGLIIGLIVLLMYLPIFELASGLQS